MKLGGRKLWILLTITLVLVLLGAVAVYKVVNPAQSIETKHITDNGSIHFQIDRSVVLKHECATVSWHVDNASAVFLNAQAVDADGIQTICPKYKRNANIVQNHLVTTLYVQYPDGTDEEHGLRLLVLNQSIQEAWQFLFLALGVLVVSSVVIYLFQTRKLHAWASPLMRLGEPWLLRLREGWGALAASRPITAISNLPGVIGFLLITALFGSILVAKWASLIKNGYGYLVSGLLPWVDAEAYTALARQLLNGFPVGVWAARRPLFTGLLASLMGVTGQNLQFIQVLLVLLNAGAAFLFVREVKRSYGLWTSTITFAVVFLFYQRYAGMMSSENLGMAMGCIALAMLLRGAREKHMLTIWLGIAFLTLGLLARAGAFFVLPALVAWGVWIFRGTRRDGLRFAIGAFAAIAVSFLLEDILRQVLTPGVMGNSNFSTTLYGVVVGNQGWAQILAEYPELRSLPDNVAAPRIYQMAFVALRAHPADALFGVLGTWGDFFSFKFPGAFSFINLVPLLSAFPAVLLFALSLLGIVFCVIARHQPSNSLSLALFLGIILSVPMVPPIDADSMRAYATTIPAQALIAGLGFQVLQALVNGRKSTDHRGNGSSRALHAIDSLAVGAGLIVLSVFVPILLKLIVPPKTNAPISADYHGRCRSDQQFLAVYITPASIHLVDDSAQFSFVPNMRVSDFREDVSISLALRPEVVSYLNKMEAGQTLLNTMDETGHNRWIIIDTEDISASSRTMITCGHQTPTLDGAFTFYQVDSVEASSP